MKKLNLITIGNEEIPETIDINEKDIDPMFINNINNESLLKATFNRMGIRCHGEFAKRAIYLSHHSNYILGTDSMGATILVALKK